MAIRAPKDGRIGRVLLVPAMLSLVLGAAACGGAPAVRLSEAAEHPPSGMIETGVPAGQPWSFGGIILCLSATGQARVTSIELDQEDGPSRLAVEAFSVRSNPMPAGPAMIAQQGALADIPGWPAQPKAVSTTCPSAAELPTWSGGSEIAVQVARRGDGTAYSRSLIVHYDTGSGDQTYTVPFGISLCVEADADACPH